MKRSIGWSWLLLLAVAILPGPAAARSLAVEVSTDRGDDGVYDPGDKMQIKAQVSDDAYLLVYDIDAEGNVRLLFPTRHGRDLVNGGETYRLPTEDADADLVVQGPVGQGYIVAIASIEPFRDLPRYLRPYDPQGDEVGYYGEPEDEDNGVTTDGRIVGDPFVAMERIRRRVVEDSQDEESFATAYASYYVHEQVKYPRYLCYDCHRPNHWSWWDGFDPYYSQCSVFSFRVNWSWGWGPRYWFGYVPYYMYVYRNDCPPRYHSYYASGLHYSSWDGWPRWNSLWGAHLTRYKSDPPTGYVPPSKFDERSRWRDTGARPPGFLAGTRGVLRPGQDPRTARWTAGNSPRERRGDLRGWTGSSEDPPRAVEPKPGSRDPWNRGFGRGDRSGNRVDPQAAPEPTARRGRTFRFSDPAVDPQPRNERPRRGDRSWGIDRSPEPRGEGARRTSMRMSTEPAGPPSPRQAEPGYGMPRFEPSAPPRSARVAPEGPVRVDRPPPPAPPSASGRAQAPPPAPARAQAPSTFWRQPPVASPSGRQR